MKKHEVVFLLLICLSFTWSACAQQQTAPAQSAQTQAAGDQQIADFVRKNFNVPAAVSINVKKSPSSEVDGLQKISIEFHTDRGDQTQEAWVTKDGKNLIIGNALSAAADSGNGWAKMDFKGQGNQQAWVTKDSKMLIVGNAFDMTVDPYKKNWSKIDLSNSPVTGAPNAKVTIVEYSDFECPYCSRAHKTVEELLKEYDGKIKVVYKHLPLTNIHPWAEDAAVAAECVYQQNNDAFWKLSSYLFTNQNDIKKDTLKDKVMAVAQESKLDSAALQKCIDTRSTLPIVQANMAEAQNLGYNSTPSFNVMGRSVIGAVELDQFKKVIDEAMAAQK